MQEPQETRVPSLSWEDTLEKEMATHSSILCLGNPMVRGALQASLWVAKENFETKQQQQFLSFYKFCSHFQGEMNITP